MEKIDISKALANVTLPNYVGAWVLQVFIVVLAVLLINFAIKLFLRKLNRKVEQSHNPWDDAFINSVGKPIRLLVWIIGILFAADIVAIKTGAIIFEAVDPMRNISIVAILAWFLIRFVKEVETAYLKVRHGSNDQFDITTAQALTKLVRISIFITASLVLMQTLGFSISGVLAFGGIGGIAVGFAAKDLLANFFGGLMIYLDRPFSVGDWIRSPDKDIEGTVEDIGWRQTRIRTFSKRPIYVPNSLFMNIIVENPSRMSHRRIYETIGIRYNDINEMSEIVNDVKAMLKTHNEIDQNQTMIVNFNQFNESSVDFFVYTFTNTTNWIKYHEVKQDVLLKISEIIESHHSSIAYPTRVLHVDSIANDAVTGAVA